MFILTSVRWVGDTQISSAPPAIVSSILEKMIAAAEAISCRSRRDTYGCKDAKDEEWIDQLWREDGTLSESYGQLFRRLVHTFDTSYHRDVLVGDQDVIWQRLHECLERAHRGRKCEVEGCPWITHACDGRLGSDYRECPLFVKGEGNATGPSSAILSLQRDGGPEANLTQTPDPAASPERSAEHTRLRDPDTTIIELNVMSGSTEDTDASSSQPVKSDDAHNASTSIHSPGTVSDTFAAAFQVSRSTPPDPTPVAGADPHALSVDPADSIAVCISPPPGRPSASEEVVPSDSPVPESPSRDADESRMEDRDASCGDVADQRAVGDSVSSAADDLPVPLAATATETGGAGASGAARGTSNQVDTPEAVVSYPTIPTPLLVSSKPRPTSTLGSQPPTSLGTGGPLLDPTGPSSVEVRSPAITTVSRGHPERESSQGSFTSRVATIDEPSQGGHLEVQDAGRLREESSGRPASSLFQGVRAVSRRSSEEFELAVREGHTGEGSGQDGQARMEGG